MHQLSWLKTTQDARAIAQAHSDAEEPAKLEDSDLIENDLGSSCTAPSAIQGAALHHERRFQFSRAGSRSMDGHAEDFEAWIAEIWRNQRGDGRPIADARLSRPPSTLCS